MCSPIHMYNTVMSSKYITDLTDICLFGQNSAYEKRLLLEGNLRPDMK